MGYAAHELAELSGVSVRTLHYYEEEGLLRPARLDNGYRDYGIEDVRRLQQVLLYRRAGMPVAKIRAILDADETEQLNALREQLDHLREQRSELDALICAVEAMVEEAEKARNGKEPVTMGGKGQDTRESRRTDATRFETFKRQAIEENERAYGKEARERYGDAAVDASNAKVAGMSREDWDEAQDQQRRIAEALAKIAASDDPGTLVRGDAGRELCELHRAWLLHYWPRGMYSPEAHKGLARMYVADPRFEATYEAMAPGGARILCDAIEAWADRVNG
jgi:DNA-binding transcriptional MerR regulator